MLIEILNIFLGFIVSVYGKRGEFSMGNVPRKPRGIPTRN